MKNIVAISGLTIMLAWSINVQAQFKFKDHYDTKYPFDQSPVPPVPDYSKTENWSALPDKKDMADLTPSKDMKDGQATAKVDVFYIYPTIYMDGDPWNADVNDQKLNAKIDRLPVKNQATVFNGDCKVYIPRYRQAHIKAFYHLDGDGKKALDLAYQDVKTAFEYYMQHYNNGRPIIIAGHSQGSYLAIRLLKEYFDGKPLVNQLVAAYTVGWPTKPETYTTLKPCADPAATGCFLDWGTYARGYSPQNDNLAKADALCVNPISWMMDTTFVPREKAKGSIGKKFTHIYKNAVDAQVHNGIVWTNTPRIPGIKFFIKLFKIKNYHIADYNLYWVDIRENVKQRVDKYLSGKAASR